MDNKTECNVYIDESGDLGASKGTRWFVISAVIVDKDEEKNIRAIMQKIKNTLNINSIHIKEIKDYYKRAYIVRELNQSKFTYVNIIFDTNKFDRSKIPNACIAYNYICKCLLKQVSTFLNKTNRIGNIILSSRGTSRDKELIDYIKDKLLPYNGNGISAKAFNKVTAKTAGSWDLLQLADVCATTMFHAHEKLHYGFSTPCFSYMLSEHLYSKDDKVDNYGIKYFNSSMKPKDDELKCSKPCFMAKK